MAQIRDAVTSEFLFEGTPLECATIAKEIGFSKVLFDDVGEKFDPNAVLKRHEENVAGLKSASTATATPDKELRDTIKKSHDDRVAESEKARKKAPAIEKARAEAAARVR